MTSQSHSQHSSSVPRRGDANPAEDRQPSLPVIDSLSPPPTSRREFLKLAAASLALSHANGCASPPQEEIFPYVEQPQELIPGRPLYFATAMPFCGYGLGLVVASHQGRPTKIEGNREHPASRGATNAFAQAEILNLYDPDRTQGILHRGQLTDETQFAEHLNNKLSSLRHADGRGIRILSQPTTSPTLARQFAQLQGGFPQARWHSWSAFPEDNLAAGAEVAFGERVQTTYDFRPVKTIVSLDADLLNPSVYPPTYAADIIDGRRLTSAELKDAEMNRLYVLESTATLTGTKADYRLAMTPEHLLESLNIIAGELGVGLDVLTTDSIDEHRQAVLTKAARDLRQSAVYSPGSGLIVAGAHLPPAVHAVVHVLNAKLGCHGTTVAHREPFSVELTNSYPTQVDSLRDLVDALHADEVELLIVLDGNPAFTAPADLEVAKAFAKADESIYLGTHPDETAKVCDWLLPAAHFLEKWSDIRGFDGTASVIQPLISPIYDGWSEHRLLGYLAKETATKSESKPASDYEIVRQTWQQKLDAEDFDGKWEWMLKRGVVVGTAAAIREPTFDQQAVRKAWSAQINLTHNSADSAELVVNFRPDPSLWDGRYANSAWLQELPRPLTKLVWDNAAIMHPSTAAQLEVANGDVLRISVGDQSIELPVWQFPQSPPGTITAHLGYGRTEVGRVGKGCGVSVAPLRMSTQLWSATANVEKTGRYYELVTTQDHHSMEGRHLIEHGELWQIEAEPQQLPFLHPSEVNPKASMLPDSWKYDSYKWGMAIDLTACVGCGVCTIACQAENNIPIVGKKEVSRGREMHWIRIDSYYEQPKESANKEDLANSAVLHQPIPCMHCEQAPCEVVCPVAATTHSDEGINEMTYNRCVGTRYCSNNCPYKVRRFNFLDYTNYKSLDSELGSNPNVTLRSRGVMEKCTYCIQRINAARIEAQTTDGSIATDSVETACQAACPTHAIAFGDLNDSKSEVVRWKANPLNYSLLAETGTRPRTTYLAEVRNRSRENASGAEGRDGPS